MRARKNGSYKGIFAITQVGYYLMRKMFRHYIFVTFEKLKINLKIKKLKINLKIKRFSIPSKLKKNINSIINRSFVELQGQDLF